MDKQNIIKVINDLFSGVDERNWKKIHTLMADKILLDYHSMSGMPAAMQTPEQVTDTWAALVPGFDKRHHQPSDFEITVSNNTAHAHYKVKADHFLKKDVWTVIANFDTDFQKKDDVWKITKQKIHFIEQNGNPKLMMQAKEIVQKQQQQTIDKKVKINSDGLLLAGILYMPKTFDTTKKYPAVFVTGSWTTVKEQMSGLYAEALAKQGYITLAIDPRYFGESEGEPRFWENPEAKEKDFSNAIAYLKTVDGVDMNNVFAVSVCASSGYMLDMIAKEKNVKAVATVAAWLHDAESVQSVYGGEKMIETKIEQAKEAKEKYAAKGKVEYVPTISKTDKNAAMVGEEFDYYLNPKRGAIPEWSADKFAVMSWEDWLTFNPMPAASKIDIPVLMIHSDDAVLPGNAIQFFENIASKDKILHWTKGTQMDFYDQPAQVEEAIAAIHFFFKNRKEEK